MYLITYLPVSVYLSVSLVLCYLASKPGMPGVPTVQQSDSDYLVMWDPPSNTGGLAVLQYSLKAWWVYWICWVCVGSCDIIY